MRNQEIKHGDDAYAFVFGVKTAQENDDLTMIEHIHPEPNCVKL